MPLARLAPRISPLAVLVAAALGLAVALPASIAPAGDARTPHAGSPLIADNPAGPVSHHPVRYAVLITTLPAAATAAG